MVMTCAKQPTLTSYIVSDYCKGYNNKEYYFTKCEDKLLSDVRECYHIRVDYNKPTKNSQCRQFENYRSIAECIKNMQHYFNIHSQFTALRTYR